MVEIFVKARSRMVATVKGEQVVAGLDGPGDGMGSAAAPVSMPTRAAVVAEWVGRAHGSAPPRASELVGRRDFGMK